MLQKSLDNTENYYATMLKISFEASERLKEMDGAGIGGRNGSDEFKAMYDALQKVSGLSIENTPLEVEQSLKDLKDSAEKYKEKIDDQTFANFRTKGKNRYEMAEKLINIMGHEYNVMHVQSHGDLDPDVKLGTQINHAAENLDEYKRKQVLRQAQNVNAPIQNVNAPLQDAPVQNEPVQNVNAPVQNANAPQQAQPEQRRKIDMNELTDAIRTERRSDARQRIQERRSLQAEQKEATEQPIRRTRTGV